MRGCMRTSVSIMVLPTWKTRSAADALAEQVLLGLRAVREAPLRELVDEEPVELLRHRAVEAAQARLEVGDGDAELGGGERRPRASS